MQTMGYQPKGTRDGGTMLLPSGSMVLRNDEEDDDLGLARPDLDDQKDQAVTGPKIERD